MSLETGPWSVNQVQAMAAMALQTCKIPIAVVEWANILLYGLILVIFAVLLNQLLGGLCHLHEQTSSDLSQNPGSLLSNSWWMDGYSPLNISKYANNYSRFWTIHNIYSLILPKNENFFQGPKNTKRPVQRGRGNSTYFCTPSLARPVRTESELKGHFYGSQTRERLGKSGKITRLNGSYNIDNGTYI